MGRSERVVDVDVGIRSQFLGKFLLLFLQFFLGCGLFLVGRELGAGLAFFLFVEAEVLEQQHFARLQGCNLCVSLHAVVAELDFGAQIALDGRDDLLERVLRVGVLFGSAHVRHQDGAAAVGQHFLDGGQGTADAGVVAHCAGLFVEGHVEVNSDYGFLAIEIETVYCSHGT